MVVTTQTMTPYEICWVGGITSGRRAVAVDGVLVQGMLLVILHNP